MIIYSQNRRLQKVSLPSCGFPPPWPRWGPLAPRSPAPSRPSSPHPPSSQRPVALLSEFHSLSCPALGDEGSPEGTVTPSSQGPRQTRGQEMGPALTAAPLLCQRKQPFSATSCPRGFGSFPFRACWPSSPAPAPLGSESAKRGGSLTGRLRRQLSTQGDAPVGGDQLGGGFTWARDGADSTNPLWSPDEQKRVHCFT